LPKASKNHYDLRTSRIEVVSWLPDRASYFAELIAKLNCLPVYGMHSVFDPLLVNQLKLTLHD
jgi:hypothetical protein